VLWALDTGGYKGALAGNAAANAVLLAYPAFPAQGTQGIQPIFEDDTGGPGAVKFAIPTVAIGHVYVAGRMASESCGSAPLCTGMLVIYGTEH
jgi:hypothetical protein